jgi:hypothetical protein
LRRERVEEAFRDSVAPRDPRDRAGDSHHAAGGHPARGPLPLIAGFPAFYRENPGILEPLVEAAEEMLSEIRTALSMAEERLERGIPHVWDRILDRPEPLAGATSRRMAGTAAGVSRWLEARHGAAPAVWAGVAALPHPAGGVIIRAARSLSAVVAWEKTAFPEAPGEISIPEDLLPAGVPVQAVVLARMPAARRPRSGERLHGEVVWERPGTAPPGRHGGGGDVGPT